MKGNQKYEFRRIPREQRPEARKQRHSAQRDPKSDRQPGSGATQKALIAGRKSESKIFCRYYEAYRRRGKIDPY